MVSTFTNGSRFFYALKGQYNMEEVSALSAQFSVDKIIELNVPELVGKRHLVLLKKIRINLMNYL